MCRVPGSTLIAYGRGCSVALRWVSFNGYRQRSHKDTHPFHPLTFNLARRKRWLSACACSGWSERVKAQGSSCAGTVAADAGISLPQHSARRRPCTVGHLICAVFGVLITYGAHRSWTVVEFKIWINQSVVALWTRVHVFGFYIHCDLPDTFLKG